MSDLLDFRLEAEYYRYRLYVISQLACPTAENAMLKLLGIRPVVCRPPLYFLTGKSLECPPPKAYCRAALCLCSVCVRVSVRQELTTACVYSSSLQRANRTPPVPRVGYYSRGVISRQSRKRFCSTFMIMSDVLPVLLPRPSLSERVSRLNGELQDFPHLAWA